MNPADLDIEVAGKRLRTGALSAVDLLRAHLDRIELHDEDIRAFVARNDDAALAAALKADAELASGHDRGPLHGIPVAIKDMIDTLDFPTEYGSARFKGYHPRADAACVSRLKACGAVIVGKVATYEFATVGPSFDTPFEPARNPWNARHITGGSSSGSAAAVAAGFVRIAIGTDTGGSVRSPAAYCGIAGLKPTFGAVSKDGVYPLSPSLDHVGVLAATAHEAGLVFDALMDNQSTKIRPKSEALDTIVIGYARDWFAHDSQTDPAIIEAMDAAASTLSLLGARIEEVSLPPYEHFEAAGAAILHREAFAVHRERLANSRKLMGAKTFRTLIAGAHLSAKDAAFAHAVGERLRETLDQTFFDRFDAIITTTTLTPAPKIAGFQGDEAVWTPMRTLAFNLTGHPALGVPAGFVGGLPFGLQIVGPMHGEPMICRIGEAFEKATDFAAQRPPHLSSG